MRITLGSYAPGSFGTEQGNTAQRATPSPTSFFLFGMQLMQIYLTVGVTDCVELEAAAGFSELALGTRVGMMSERRGDPFSAAIALTGTFRLVSDDGLGARASLDLGRDLGGGTLLVRKSALGRT